MKIEIRLDGGITRYAHRLAALADELPRAERQGLACRLVFVEHR